MADRWRCVLVTGIAAAVLGLPAGAAAKPPAKRACQSAAAKAKKPRCRASANHAARPGTRGVDPGHIAPVAILDDAPAPRAGRVLEI